MPAKKGKAPKQGESGSTAKAGRRGGGARKQAFKVRVRWFQPDFIRVRGVEIEVLRPVKTVELEEVGDSPLDALINVVERLSQSKEGVFEVEVSDGVRHVMGEAFLGEEETEGRMLLSPRPARLLAVGVIRVREAVEKGEHGETALFRLPAGAVRMARVREEVYVYEGRVRAPEDVYLIVLDTDKGRRYVRVAREPIIEPLVRHVLTRPSQDQESPVDGRGQGEDSTPSS